MGFWSNVLGFFGIKTKESKEEEQRKIEVLQRIKSSTREPEVYKSKKEDFSKITGETQKQINEIEDYEQEKRQSEIKSSPEGLNIEDKRKQKIKDKIKAMKEGKSIATIEYKKRMALEINPQRLVIETGNITSQQELQDSRYDIYRNLILKNIKDDKLVQQIYQSGMLNEHIVCKIIVHGYHRGTGTAWKWVQGIWKLEKQGLTPDKTLESGILLKINSFQSGTTEDLNNILETEGLSIENDSRHEEYKIEKIDIQYDYA